MRNQRKLIEEDAKEVSNLTDYEFEKAYDKAFSIAESVMQHEVEKMDKFLKHFAKEIEEHKESFSGKLFK
jgi:acyl-CoA reductase-like NAD-dependent aldehyde dehydrogenase